MWSDPGAWIAIGVSVLFIVVVIVMHRVFVRVLKSTPPAPPDAGDVGELVSASPRRTP